MTEITNVGSIRRVFSLPFRRPSKERSRKDTDGSETGWLKRASSCIQTAASVTRTSTTVSAGSSRFASAEPSFDSMSSNELLGSFDVLDQTWHDWVETYQQGTRNLSSITRPVCFTGYGHMSPPESARESERLAAVSRLENRRSIVKQKDWLESLLRPILAQYRLSCATLSIIDSSCQNIVFQIGLGSDIKIISRKLSIDGHTILSREYFALLDASSDWRTQFNPLVHGPPFLKFYLGVPLLSQVDDQPVGALAVFDPYLRTQIPRGLVQALQLSAQRIMEQFETLPSAPRPRIEWPNHGSDGESPADSESQVAETPLTVDGESGVPEFCLTHTKPGLSASFQPLGKQVVLQPYQVFESLLKCRSFRQAFVKACHITSRTLGLEMVYVLEVRARNRYIMSADVVEELLGNGNDPVAKEQCPDFERKPKTLMKKSVNVRKVGSNRGTYEPELDKKILLSALSSEFGLKYTANEFAATTTYPSGLLIPFRRTATTLSRRPASATSSPSSSCLSMTPPSASDQFSFEASSKAVEVSVQWGGFVMCGFSTSSCNYSPGDVTFMKKVVRALENIIMCQQEQGLEDSPVA